MQQQDNKEVMAIENSTAVLDAAIRAAGGPWGRFLKTWFVVSLIAVAGPSVAILGGIAFMTQTPALLC